MTLAPGARIGSYEVVALVGTGGMGEVYRARDSKLDRFVAIKVLPELVASDPDRIARFEREARTLAALNHPNIAQIHGLEEAGGVRALVMELVEGATLSDRIASGPMPVNAAVLIARQIAEALEAAHAQGIIHRDLKPANIKVRPDGTVKVLDFGLAKAFEPAGAASVNVSQSPTMTTPAGTQAGVILGTTAYMSPEQARGDALDQRADVWAFGCVLYEMVTGRAAFEGASVPDILSCVLQRDPDWTRVPRDVPLSIHRLLRLCLEKDVKKRRQAAGDVRIDLEQALSEAGPTAQVVRDPGSRLGRLAWVAGAVVVIAALAIPVAIHLRETPPAEMRLQIVTPPTLAPLHFALSPDGRFIVFVASESEAAAQRLYLRALDSTEAQPLAGTEGARYPFWSADSRSVGFFAVGMLYRVDLSGGDPHALAAAPAPQGGTWNADGTILFVPNTVSPLLRIPASGGEPEAVTRLDAPVRLGHRLPFFLPDGRQFLFYAQGEPEVSGIYLGSLDGQAPRRLTDADSSGKYLAPDLVVFVQQGALVARRLDEARGELVGDPVMLTASVGVERTVSVGGFSTSATGLIAYRSGIGAQSRTTWFDRAGTVLEQVGAMNGPEISPDGRRAAFDRTIQGNRDVWIRDLARSGLTRFTFHAAVDGFPVWSPDGTRLIFHSTRNGTFDIWTKASSGGGEEQLVFSSPDDDWPLSWSKDGRMLLYQRSNLKEKWDLWALPLTGDAREPIAVASTPFTERLGEFSPDGRWVAYETDESGRPEVVVQDFPDARGKWQVSTGGGVAPRWRADGQEIYFIAPDGKMTAVHVTMSGDTLEAGKPEALFSVRPSIQSFKAQYAVSRDGRFLVNEITAAEATSSPITLVLNRTP